MKDTNMAFPIPYGTKDLLPGEAGSKRELETSLAALFTQWGYEEVVTPVMEYLETLTAGSAGSPESMFKFFDPNNRVVALRPDMTTPIARMAATRLKETAVPLRLFYLTNVFRHEQYQAGRQCEFYQAGVEFIGHEAPGADAEVVALAVESLLDTGITQFQISLGQVEFINGMLEESGLPPAGQQAVKQALSTRNLVGLEEVLRQSPIEEERRRLIAAIPRLHGKIEVIKQAMEGVNAKSRAALENLGEIYRLLTDYGVAQYVNFDLGLIRDFEYYTGMVFEGYTPGLGFPVCGGGRYDHLVGTFGAERPATGFALGLERVMLALERQGMASSGGERDVYVAWAENFQDQAIRQTLVLRKEGQSVVLAVAPTDRAGAEQAQKEKQCRKLIYLS